MSDSATTSDPAARSYTALFVLLCRMTNGLRGTMGKGGRDIDYPVNRPGQNSMECYVLSVLVFSLLLGFFTVVIVGLLGSHAWSFALALPLGFLLTFVVLHILFFGFAFIYHRLQSIHLFSPSAPEELPVGVYLNFFTLFAIGLAFTDCRIFLAVATPWLLWASINFIAAIILFAGEFISLLSGEPE